MNTTIKIPASVARLQTKALHDKLEELTGTRPTSRNKPYLQRQLVKALAEQQPARPRRASRTATVAEVIEGVNTGRLAPEPLPAAPTPPPAPPSASRRRRSPATAKPVDRRLPAVGSILTREYEGRTHNVTVLDGGLFSYKRETYKSLSTIAKVITGTIWNGFLFFHLTPYPTRNKHAA